MSETSSRRAVWVARYQDHSAAVAYGNELEALRHAVERNMEVVRVPYGEDILRYQPDDGDQP